MSITNNNTIRNIANNKNVRGFVSKLCTPGTIASIAVLEGCVTAGRTYQANERGGKIEARERLTEEVIAGVIWLFGIQVINKGLDFLIDKVGNIKKKTGLKDFHFDTGNDHIRKPFEHVTKGMTEGNKKLVSALKFSKIVASTAMAVGLIGFVLPKINQKITKNVLQKEQEKNKNTQNATPSTKIQITPQKRLNKVDMNEFLDKTRKNNTVQFNGGTFFETAAHYLENDTITQLWTQEGGLFTGRAINARNQYERNEILLRDITSSFFYALATPMIYMLLCKVDSLKGKNTDLSPEVTHKLHEKMDKLFANGSNSMDAEEFKAKLIGKSQVSDDVFKKAGDLFERDIATVDRMHSFIEQNVQDKELAQSLKTKALKLAKLQPNQNEKAILTKSQLTNLFHDGLINDPELVNAYINELTDKKAMDPIKFIAQKKVDQKRNFIVNYAQSIFERASKTGQKTITKDFLGNMKARNLVTKMGYWGAGMAVSALFLSTIIPKVQYWMTRKATGHNDFPGIQNYETKK